MQIIFNQEIQDGLEDKISKAKASFNCPLLKLDKPSDITLKSVASFAPGRNFDLYYLQSILASVGPNKNDDVFLPEEIWAARHTPVHKQLNYMHNEKDIIGVITDSVILDSQGVQIFDESLVTSIKDIATQAVIWTHWEDELTTAKVNKIIASIEENELFVSMEALFKKFDYMIVEGSQVKIIERTEATSFLTKYLKSFGGNGLYENNRIYRVLRDFTFSGKGIVTDPANPGSIIDDNLFVSNSNTKQDDPKPVISTKAETIMEDEMKKEIAELKAALAKANEAIESAKAAEISKTTAELEDLKSQVVALKTLAADTKAKMDEMEKECAEKMEEQDKKSKEKMDEAEARVKVAEAKLAEVLAEKIVADRCNQLITENVDADEAKALVKTFASLNDELFSQVVAIHKKSGKAVKAQAETETVEDAIDKAKASQTVDAKVTDVEVNDDELTSLSKSIASKLFTKKNTKGDK